MPARNAAVGRTARVSPHAASGRAAATRTPRLVHVFAGQSNCSAYSKMIVLGPTASVPGYAQTALNEWIGVSPSSVDSATIYPFPTAGNSPGLYNENTNGTIGALYDYWGPVVKQYPTSSAGALTNTSPGASGIYGLELSFLQSHLNALPGVPVAGIKVALGGTALAADWMPANTGSNGTASDKGEFAILRLALTQAAARLNASGGPWRWGSFVWMQGENGAHTQTGIPANDSSYLSDARAMFAVVRSLTRSNLPVVIGRIDNRWGWESTPNTYLTAAGYPYAAIDASISFNAGTNGDGRIAGGATPRANCLGGAVLRRATQVTLGGDANCTWWSNDDLPPRPPYWKAHSDYWGYTTSSLTFPDATGIYDFYAYHDSGPGNLTRGERAYAAYRAIAN